jgi:hypothetical protein
MGPLLLAAVVMFVSLEKRAHIVRYSCNHFRDFECYCLQNRYGPSVCSLKYIVISDGGREFFFPFASGWRLLDARTCVLVAFNHRFCKIALSMLVYHPTM